MVLRVQIRDRRIDGRGECAVYTMVRCVHGGNRRIRSRGAQPMCAECRQEVYVLQRCCRDHRNKLDLDSMLISPIQRVPR